MAAALIAVDVQNAFKPPLKQAIPNITALIERFKSRGLPCILTQHGHTEAELQVPSSNQLVNKFSPEGSIAVGGSGWRHVAEVEALAEGCLIVTKNSYDAFVHTELEQLLLDRNVTRVFICGALTDYCVDTTARSAFNRGFETLVIKDACGSYGKAQHREGLDSFTRMCGELTTTKEVLKEVT